MMKTIGVALLLLMLSFLYQEELNFRVANKTKHTLTHIRVFGTNLQGELKPNEQSDYYQTIYNDFTEEAILMVYVEGKNYGIYVPLSQRNNRVTYIIDSIDTINRNILIRMQVDE
ncbi:hypothetical protein [Galbibacter mesophilus]|uniref:hypothetical protein n=1 Tax=Galbibacter mesophilus TaxID=379069 RepID=UPI00191EF2E4|nr:hypothetical protein [Galbibacter mesophilus]MCM5663426.1 hypothetical protein [Galbibacter mesophilus]